MSCGRSRAGDSGPADAAPVTQGVTRQQPNQALGKAARSNSPWLMLEEEYRASGRFRHKFAKVLQPLLVAQGSVLLQLFQLWGVLLGHVVGIVPAGFLF